MSLQRPPTACSSGRVCYSSSSSDLWSACYSCRTLCCSCSCCVRSAFPAVGLVAQAPAVDVFAPAQLYSLHLPQCSSRWHQFKQQRALLPPLPFVQHLPQPSSMWHSSQRRITALRLKRTLLLLQPHTHHLLLLLLCASVTQASTASVAVIAKSYALAIVITRARSATPL